MVLAFPKPQPKLLEKRAADAAWQAKDKAESLKVKARSMGRCEVWVRGYQCGKRATEIHHHLFGWKLRGRGESALAINKTHCCSACHRLITGHVLQHVAGTRYRSVE